MIFKDFLRADLETFINLEEFAEEVDIGGKFVKAVISRNSNKSASTFTVKKQINPLMHTNLSGDFLTIYVKAADLKTPKSGDFLSVNGSRYRVQSAEVLQGILKVTCATDRG